VSLQDGFLYAGMLCLALGAWDSIRALRRSERRILVSARINAGVGLGLHVVELAAEGIRTARFPVSGAAEGFIFLSCVLLATALILDGLKGWSILVVATLPLSLVMSAAAAGLGASPGGGTPSNLSSLWLGMHIFTALGATAAFGLAFVAGVLYLVAQRQLKVHASGSILGWMPPLETVARLQRRAVFIGILLQLGGLVVGYLQARKVMGLGADWRQDPKIWLTTMTLFAYVAILTLGERPGFKGRRAALATCGAFLLVMLTFWASVFWSGFHRFH
jgi:ABC-type uncharacterized transport system permease subunit